MGSYSTFFYDCSRGAAGCFWSIGRGGIVNSYPHHVLFLSTESIFAPAWLLRSKFFRTFSRIRRNRYNDYRSQSRDFGYTDFMQQLSLWSLCCTFEKEVRLSPCLCYVSILAICHLFLLLFSPNLFEFSCRWPFALITIFDKFYCLTTKSVSDGDTR